MLRLGISFVLGAVVFSSGLLADDLSYINGEVTHVRDGDTIEVTDQQGKVWAIRLFGIDTPEHEREDCWEEQPHAVRSAKFTEGLVADAQVTVTVRMTLQDGRFVPVTTYDRYVGEVFVNGISLNRELVRAGHAWWYEKYAPEDLDFRRLEESARKAKRGLWSRDNAVAPWVWRKE